MNVNEIIMNKRIERGVSRKELAEGFRSKWEYYL